MEHQPDKLNFDFTKKLESIVEEHTSTGTPIITKIKFVSFLALGGLSIGVGLGLTNGFMEGYKISKASEAKIAEMKASSEQQLKAKTLEIDAQAYAKKVEKENQQKEASQSQASQLEIEKDRQVYDLWIKNKEDIIANYESQLGLYDKAYQNILKAVNLGGLPLNELDSIRGYYQQYKVGITKKINYIERRITSFEYFRTLDKENRDYLQEMLVDYQAGNLTRNSQLENLLLEGLGRESRNEKVAKIRNEIRNDVIDNLAQVMNPENDVTKTKKLKR